MNVRRAGCARALALLLLLIYLVALAGSTAPANIVDEPKFH